VRVNEFFKDFDRLRNGYITRDQFHRCLNQHFGVTLSDDEFRSLVAKYSVKREGMVNYKQFCEAIDFGFNPNLLDSMPEQQLSRMLVQQFDIGIFDTDLLRCVTSGAL
jgi:hypothetical protein